MLMHNGSFKYRVLTLYLRSLPMLVYQVLKRGIPTISIRIRMMLKCGDFRYNRVRRHEPI